MASSGRGSLGEVELAAPADGDGLALTQGGRVGATGNEALDGLDRARRRLAADRHLADLAVRADQVSGAHDAGDDFAFGNHRAAPPARLANRIGLVLAHLG